MTRFIYAIVCANPDCLESQPEEAWHLPTLAAARQEKKELKGPCGSCSHTGLRILRTPAKPVWDEVK